MLDIEDDGKKLKGGVFVASHERKKKKRWKSCTSIAGGVSTYGLGHLFDSGCKREVFQRRSSNDLA